MSINLNQSINPTKGFVEYVKDIKPYHTKILDVNIDYVYSDDINLTIRDSNRLTLSNSIPDVEILRNCGWGIEWDPIKTTADYPSVKVIKAYGDILINVVPTAGTTELVISYNPDGYVFQIGDPVTFSTTGTLPNLTVSTTISPGLVYYIMDVQPTTITISTSQTGLPLTFLNGGTGTLSIHPANIPYNCFDVEPEYTPSVTNPLNQSPEFTFIVSDITHHYMTFVNNYPIIDVQILNRIWAISGDQVSNYNILVDNIVYVRDNTGVGANVAYTVESVLFDGTNTLVTVVEPISIQAAANGTLGVSFNETSNPPWPIPKLSTATKYWPTPSWAIGTKVKVTSNNRLPYPLSSNTSYYYVPLQHLGIFALSRKRYPTSIFDLIDISSFGVGELKIQRTETFYPGASIKVDSSYQSRNDGMYYVQNTIDYGSFVRLVVTQKINRITPSNKQHDGIASIVSDGWDYPYLCPLIQADELYTEAFIHEHLWLSFDDSYTGLIGVNVVEEGNTVVVVSSPGYTILLTGYDTQLFGIGSLDENVDTLP